MKISYVIKHLTGTLTFYLLIFLSAGKVLYFPGLAYVILGLITFTLNYTALKPDSELLAERAKPGEGAKKWDKVLLGLSLPVTIAMYVIAGLDSGRYHWSPDFHWSLILPGIIMTATGQILFLFAQKQNRFFSSTVRIQTDRNQTVCETGLYGVVRHPAYLGSVIQSAGFPLLFGSLWSIVPSGLLIIIQIIRTIMEDKTLMTELIGYETYSSKVRYRLIPLFW